MVYYKHYLLGRQFVARTDHQALKWLYSLQEPRDRIARWLVTLSGYQFSIEYWPGNKHGNANAMSRRCPNPEECKCPLLEEEILKCGPCQKFCQRAETMDSTLMDSQGNLRSMQVQGDEAVHMVQTQSQTQGQQVESGDAKTVPIVIAAKGRGRPKHGRTGCHRGNDGKKSLTRGGVAVQGTDTNAQALTSSPGTPGKEPASSQEKPVIVLLCV